MKNRRILIIDDDPGIRETYHNILTLKVKKEILSKGANLFNKKTNHIKQKQIDFKLSMSTSGEDGIDKVRTSLENDEPFAAAFIDMKMPGIDGAETSKKIWELDPDIKIVIVTAYSEYTPDDIIRVIGNDEIFYLRKPFNPEEIKQFARVLVKKWNLEKEKKLLSENLKSTNEQLEDINKNLQEKINKQAKILAQNEKMTSIGILAAGVAHEINNPIAFIKGNLSAIKKYNERLMNLFQMYGDLEDSINNKDSKSITDFINDIADYKRTKKIDFIFEDIISLGEESLDGAIRVENIVKDLKTFSRVDKSEFMDTDINESIEVTLNILRNETKYKIEIVKNYGKLPEIKCLSQKISQAFMNIILNSIQAIDEKGTITISTKHIEGRRRNDNVVEIIIKDTGNGIPEENISQLFDPFYTTKPVGKGTGLGLSITYDIIIAHGGSITVASEPGVGSEFTIKIPVDMH
ncbi:MAG: response regulator [Desulfobacterales bacterium]|nr:response regulator [Desulfobacterales bacterium]MCP4160851.1 response regulator [Deltaproteobacteria bacterium]